jgi:hypothetical protein
MLSSGSPHWLAAVTALAVAASSAMAQQPPAQRTADATKTQRIERPTERVVADSSAPAATGDGTNSKVEPGKIRWHSSLAVACDAAQKSGKPVLLFQMMGKLDDRFC